MFRFIKDQDLLIKIMFNVTLKGLQGLLQPCNIKQNNELNISRPIPCGLFHPHNGSNLKFKIMLILTGYTVLLCHFNTDGQS
jgi:hypothetical protein